MQSGLVSIVVPIYKTEKYLDRCIESIVHQTYQNLEIILVDDGSPDSCPQICDEWAGKDSRIRVIHKENAGLGMARNTGIDAANGEYICFFDSDDYVSLTLIEKAYNRIVSEKADVVLYGYISANPEKNCYVPQIPSPTRNVYQDEDVQNVFLPEFIDADPITRRRSYIPRGACAAMYSVAAIRRANWYFISEREIISEDIYSHLELYRSVKKVAVLNEALYYYCVNCASLSRSYRKDRYTSVKHFYQECIKLCYESGYSATVIRRCMEPYVGFTIAVMKQEVAFHGKYREAKEALGIIINDDLLQQALLEKKNDKMGLKRKMLFWAIRHKHIKLCYGFLVAQNTSKK